MGGSRNKQDGKEQETQERAKIKGGSKELGREQKEWEKRARKKEWIREHRGDQGTRK